MIIPDDLESTIDEEIDVYGFMNSLNYDKI